MLITYNIKVEKCDDCGDIIFSTNDNIVDITGDTFDCLGCGENCMCQESEDDSDYCISCYVPDCADDDLNDAEDECD